jgi:catalase
MAVKFYLPDNTTTDIVTISLPAFFTRTPEDLLAFNAARRPDPSTGQPDINKVGEFLAQHPETMTAVNAAITHPIPVSFATLRYNSLHAYGFEASDGSLRHGRYHFVPDGGERSLTDEEAAAKPPDYLRDELAQRLEKGPAVFHLELEIASEDDPVDDPTAVWPEGRETKNLGRLDIIGLANDRERDGDILVFDPTRTTSGISITNDAILLARPGAYSVSIARRTAKSVV